jgi:hypothetical protein
MPPRRLHPVGRTFIISGENRKERPFGLAFRRRSFWPRVAQLERGTLVGFTAERSTENFRWGRGLTTRSGLVRTSEGLGGSLWLCGDNRLARASADFGRVSCLPAEGRPRVFANCGSHQHSARAQTAPANGPPVCGDESPVSARHQAQSADCDKENPPGPKNCLTRFRRSPRRSPSRFREQPEIKQRSASGVSELTRHLARLLGRRSPHGRPL